MTLILGELCLNAQTIKSVLEDDESLSTNPATAAILVNSLCPN